MSWMIFRTVPNNTWIQTGAQILKQLSACRHCLPANKKTNGKLKLKLWCFGAPTCPIWLGFCWHMLTVVLLTWMNVRVLPVGLYKRLFLGSLTSFGGHFQLFIGPKLDFTGKVLWATMSYLKYHGMSCNPLMRTQGHDTAPVLTWVLLSSVSLSHAFPLTIDYTKDIIPTGRTNESTAMAVCV